jgi:hypothetical protein
VLRATAKPTFALPSPLGEVTVIQGTFAVADHAHVVVSNTDPPPAVAAIANDGGLSAYVHSTGAPGCGDADAATWITVNDCPATARAATRSVPAFGSTANSTTPEPFPGDPAATLTHADGLVAVHEHPAIVDTVSRKLPPLAATDCEPDPETTYSHAAGPC